MGCSTAFHASRSCASRRDADGRRTSWTGWTRSMSIWDGRSPPGSSHPIIFANLWVVAEPEERTIGPVMDLLGEDRVLWGSDFPHIDSTLEAPRLIRESVATLSQSRRIKLLGANARQVFQV